MSEVDKDYELKVLKMMINRYLDETVPVTWGGLWSLEVNRDHVVWELATKIYSQSGHKVEFHVIRDVVNCRIGPMKAQLEKARRAAEEEARRIAEEKARQAAEEAACRRDRMTRILGELRGDEAKAKVFVMVQKIVSEQLNVDESEVHLDGHLSNDLGVDELDVIELVMALEEEFDIEILDEEACEVCEVKEVVDLIYKKVSV